MKKKAPARKQLATPAKPDLIVRIIGAAVHDADALFANDHEDEFWCLNAIRPGWIPVSRITRCFNLHRYTHLRRDWHDGVYAEAAWANRYPQIPFTVVDKWPTELLPNQVLLPRAALEAMPNGKYHASSFDWMVALALMLGAKKISLHGINFGPVHETGEPLSARPCLEYWLGYAQGLGVKVEVARDCASLFKQFHYVRSTMSYGFDDVRMVEERP